MTWGGAIAAIGAVTAVISVTGVVLFFVFRKKESPRQLKDPKANVALRLVDRQLISPDTIRLKLALDSPQHILGLPVGNHVYLSARINGELVVRPYTPISLDSQKGYVDFVIKVYKANVNQNYPKGGKMSQYLLNLPISQYINVRGPAGNLHYKGDGLFSIRPDNNSPFTEFKVKQVSMICGGSGVTPMFQLLSYILSRQSDVTKVAMLYANNTEKDILLRDELDAFKDKYPHQFRVWYTVKDAPEHWNYGTGFVDEKMLTEHIYPPGEDSLVLLCGPPPMLELACYPNLAKLKYPKDRMFTF
ncbi:unnamed protein product [Calicophoron daubneyi]|uniref:NADH-cytochrome b5 reductase n=1 Tax=Calicophoron daubneyi TaxID=300641 RepID=A0AAV2T718_CALDB